MKSFQHALEGMQVNIAEFKWSHLIARLRAGLDIAPSELAELLRLQDTAAAQELADRIEGSRPRGRPRKDEPTPAELASQIPGFPGELGMYIAELLPGDHFRRAHPASSPSQRGERSGTSCR